MIDYDPTKPVLARAGKLLPMTDQEIDDHLDGRTTDPDPITHDDLRSMAASLLATSEARDQASGPLVIEHEAAPP
jgi:hypothetical protein